MSTTASPVLTFEEFEQLPDKPGKRELLDGELIELPPAKKRHSDIAHRIYKLLERYLEQRADGRTVYLETGYLLGPRLYIQPDVSIPHPNQRAGDYWEGAPLLGVEVLSKANRAPDVQRKLTRYFENGGQEVWLVYPEAGVIEVHHAGESAKYTAGFMSRLLPGLTIDVERLLQ